MGLQETPDPDETIAEARHEPDEKLPVSTQPSKAVMNFALKEEVRFEEEFTSEEGSMAEHERKPRQRKAPKKKTTHLRMQDRNLHAIPKLTTCSNLVVLYLYNNRIDKIQNLEVLSQLTHLYLSHNDIQRLDNLSELHRLQKLYISHNKISVVERLEGLGELRELHLGSQRLPSGDCLTFDPRSIAAIRGSLQVLDVSNCGVTSISALAPLMFLRDLLVKDNELESLVDMKETLSELPSLSRLEIKGNPLCNLQRYKDWVVEGAPFLRTLDRVEITPAYRQFLAGRGAAVAAVARRQSNVSQHPQLEQPPAGHSASADVIKNSSDVTSNEPRSTLSHGSLPPLKSNPGVFQDNLPPSKPPRWGLQARQTSSTHVRVGNMLTLTPQQRVLVRTATSERELRAEPSSGDTDSYSLPPRPQPSLPHCPARVPARGVASAEAPGRRSTISLVPW